MNRGRLFALVFLGALLLACISLSDRQQAASPTPTSSPDPTETPVLSVAISSPPSGVFVSDHVTIQAVVIGGTADELKLFRDELPLVTLDPPYTFNWDTTFESEGEHALVAKALFGSVWIASPALALNVDHVPPSLVTGFPGSTYGSCDAAIATFSERLDPATVNTGTVQVVDVDGTPVAASVVLANNDKAIAVRPFLTMTPIDLIATLDGIRDRAGKVLPTSTQSWTVPSFRGTPLEFFPSPLPDEQVVAIATNGAAVVAYLSWTNFADLNVARVGESVWEPLGGVLDSGATIHVANPSLTFLPNGAPIVGFVEIDESLQNPEPEIVVKRWSGSDWEPATLPLFNEILEQLAVSPSGEIYAATRYEALRLYRWDGVSWQRVGSNLTSGNGFGIFSLSLTFDSVGAPVVSYTENSAVRVRKWSGTAWTPYPDLVTGIYQPDNTSLALDASDKPVVASATFTEYLGGDVFVSRWTGTSWVSLGGGPIDLRPGERGAYRPQIGVLADSTIVVSWDEEMPMVGNGLVPWVVMVEFWNGNDWITAGCPYVSTLKYGSKSSMSVRGTTIGESWFERDEQVARFMIKR